MAIPLHSSQTGDVWISDFDLGVMNTFGASPDTASPIPTNNASGLTGSGGDRCFKVVIPGVSSPDGKVPVYFQDPEAAYRYKTYPCVVVEREDHSLALHRWMSVGQMEYRAGVGGQVVIGGVSGYTQYIHKPQAMPYDFIYTITAYDRYERPAQTILKKILQSFPPVGKLFVKDSLGLQRSYEVYHEGGISPRHEIVDPATRFRGYSITIRVEGELDLMSPVEGHAVTGVDLNIYRMKP